MCIHWVWVEMISISPTVWISMIKSTRTISIIDCALRHKSNRSTIIAGNVTWRQSRTSFSENRARTIVCGTNTVICVSDRESQHDLEEKPCFCVHSSWENWSAFVYSIRICLWTIITIDIRCVALIERRNRSAWILRVLMDLNKKRTHSCQSSQVIWDLKGLVIWV